MGKEQIYQVKGRTNGNRIFGFTYSLFHIACCLFFLCASNVKAFADETCVTEKCHSSIASAAVVHPAVPMGCSSCHEAVSQPHPQKAVKTFKLTQEPPGLCATCHPPFGTKKYVHDPVKNGMCTSCHDPHSSAQQKLLLKPANELCLMCHTDKTGFKYMHGPTAAGDCLACHDPHESDNPAHTKKPQPEVCFACHTDMQQELNKAFKHPALEGGCTSCHNPHGSEFKKFFAVEGNKLCFQCHPQIEEKIKASVDIHPPIKSESGCVSCHSPHASDAEKLLPKSGKDFCLTCHTDIIKPEYTVLHGPIRDGKCLPCHDPHASANAKLLVKSFPTEMYVPYSDKEYELCFSCHNRDMLLYAQTSYATGFRDGDRNLHYVHVNRKDKGRSCTVCHTIHGGTQPKLINQKIPFGNWSLPIRFTKTENGGSCAPGCHRPLAYDRKSAVNVTAPAETK
ncbi:MAG TPA: cytochrome c3 family protein [Dissulfurispiraceae bacterium]|nr:cytochrome c3 family protein [Dissulfurispiraceae bacterium]